MSLTLVLIPKACALASGLATFYPEHFAGFAFLAVRYLKPEQEFNIDKLTALRDMNASFFKIVRPILLPRKWIRTPAKNPQGFCSPGVMAIPLGFALTLPLPLLGVRDVGKQHGASGELEKWLENDTRTPPPEYLPQADFDRQKQDLLKGGMTGPLCWDKLHLRPGGLPRHHGGHGFDLFDISTPPQLSVTGTKKFDIGPKRYSLVSNSARFDQKPDLEGSFEALDTPYT
ncbi:hypothetical protein B0H13DRAFT_1851354 [Mycena leptocephala]|nr:hypothetical protein B0H13DRAFT_1851354 [Mycena leptocephala]